MTEEGRIQASIEKYLKSLIDKGYPLWFEKRQAGGFSYKKGIADLYGVFNGLHFEVEIKRPGGQRSAMQEKWEERCLRTNTKYACCDSLQKFKTFFENVFLSNYK